MTALYRKDGGAPQEIPFSAHDATGRLWTDLPNNQEGREATGWEEAPAKPIYDPTEYNLIWSGTDWALQEIPPPPPTDPVPVPLTRIQFVELAMTVASLTPEAFMAAKQDPALAFFWELFDLSGTVERDHPFTQMGAAQWVASGHMTEDQKNSLFAQWPMT